MTNFFLFLCAVPLGVWLLANVCSVMDEPNPIAPTLRLVAGLCIVLIFLLLTSVTFWQPIAWALAFVMAAHLIAYYMLFRSGLGVAVYRQQPPTTPLLLEEASDSTQRAE
ncbi:MAG: hypothetical protein ACFHXK_08805 [bacterium]